MNIESIKQLLERYYSGTSSLEEERTLVEFFTSGITIPPELEPDRKVFEMITNNRDSHTTKHTSELPHGLMSRIEKNIDNHSARHNRKQRLRLLGGAAAAAMLTISIGIATYFYTETGSDNTRVLTDDQACHYTEMSLQLLISALERGSSESEQAQETLLNTTSTAVSQIKKI